MVFFFTENSQFSLETIGKHLRKEGFELCSSSWNLCFNQLNQMFDVLKHILYIKVQLRNRKFSSNISSIFLEGGFFRDWVQYIVLTKKIFFNFFFLGFRSFLYLKKVHIKDRQNL